MRLFDMHRLAGFGVEDGETASGGVGGCINWMDVSNPAQVY